MTTIYQALSAVMNDVGAVGKGGWNDAPGAKYNFRGVDDVINAVGPILRKHGVIVVPELVTADYEIVTVGKNRTEMSSVRLQVKFHWFGPEGDEVVASVAAESFDSGDKATAKAHSVAYRTALIQTLCLPTDERDPEQDTYERSEPAPDPAVTARTELLELLNRIGISPGEAAERFAADGHGEIGRSRDVAAIKALTTHYREVSGEVQP
ncbi:ERF family protein [Nocardia vulneris]|uniref:ERF family protein n=1 Tax=Nocardia vulneris TaxID=1141657 RepID=UPI0007C66192|nr:ERF family protein [Nocardia vulneris]